MGFWDWVKKKYQRFVKGVEHVVDFVGHALDVAHLIHTVYEVGEAVASSAVVVAKGINCAAGYVCSYLETTALSGLSSPFCFLQAANLYWASVVTIVVVGGLMLHAFVK
jgi:hypothetical protein